MDPPGATRPARLHFGPIAMNSQLIDTFGRTHDNLRVSVTDRCNLRCTYCMPEHVSFMDKAALLTFEEIVRVVRLAVRLGVRKVRLTGGEPLLRRDLPSLVRMLRVIEALADLSLTTNGTLLAEQAQPLYEAGLRRINVSLDALDRDRFRQLTRRDELDRVLQGIEAARSAGFSPIKVNAVAVRGQSEDEIVPLARFARDRGLEVRFIEYMPIGAGPWERAKLLPAHEILDAIEQGLGPLVPAGGDPRAPATDFRFADGAGTVGVIASVTRPFCARCNRIRLTPDGKLRNCLFALDEVDLRALLRSGAGDAEVADAIGRCVRDKWAGHAINTFRFVKPLRTMHAIGG